MNSNDTRRSWMVGGGVLGVATLALATFLLWPSTSTPCPPLLSVRTTPEGALVSLNGSSLGTTPFSDLALADTIEQAVLRIEKTGYVSVDTTVVAVAGELVSVILSLEQRDEALQAVLMISSTPGDARVHIDGEYMGSTDGAGQFPDVEDVEPGEVLVEIFKEGYTPWSDTLQVEAGETRTIDAELESVRDDPPPVAMATLTLHVQPGCSVSVVGQNCPLGVPCSVPAGLKQFTLRWAQGQKTETRRLNAGTQRELTC